MNMKGGGIIPEGCKGMVLNMKEVVGNITDFDIYSTLLDSNMDPNEAVHRLLSQHPFHEVKSKREKKKENKFSEPKSRGTSNYSSRGGKGGSDHYAGRGGTQFSSSESGTSHGKPSYKKENGSTGYGSQSSVPSGITGNSAYRRPPVYSESNTGENKATVTDTTDNSCGGSMPSSGFTQPSSGNQPVWGGVPGQVSMADIVKMGRSQARASSAGNQHRSNPSYHDVNSTEVSPDEEWPLVEPSRVPPAVQSVPEWPTESSNIADKHPEPEDEEPAVEEAYDENVNANHDEYSRGTVQNNNSDDVYESYQPHANAVEHQEVEDVGVSVPSVTANLQQLKVADEREAAPEEEEAAVIIPNHLQFQTADCFNLSFGSFGSLGSGPTSSVPLSSRPTDGNTEEASADGDAPSAGHLDTRNSEYYGDESLRTGSDGNLVHRTGTSGATAYDSPSVSQSEVLNVENHEGSHENQYAFPSNYSFENDPQLNASFPPSQSSPQMQNYSNQAYANTLPNSLLGASAQSARESDFSYSPFAMGQSMPAKYGNTLSSVSSSTNSMPEVLKAAGFASSLQNPQNLSGSNIATGPAIPQQLMQQYSQMSPYANLIGYHPYLPQSYYMPGAFQQAAFTGTNAYHQSLGAVPPQQYKNNVSASSLPQSGAVPSGYGGSFGSSTSLPGNFPSNQPSAPSATAVGYEDVLSSQYKEASHLLALQQQNENQAMYRQQQMSGIPANAYYNYHGQSQQQPQQQQQPPSGYRQNQQQLPQNYGSLGNSNFYHSQSGMLMDHQQQQNPRDGSLVASQVQANKQSQQLWQNSY